MLFTLKKMRTTSRIVWVVKETFESLDVREIIVENLFVVKLYIFEDNEETVS